MEQPPKFSEQPEQPEKKPSVEEPRLEEKSPWKEASVFEQIKEIFMNKADIFLQLSDEPGEFITQEEKLRIMKSGNVEEYNQMVAKKSGGEHGDIKYEGSKYRKNSFVTFLGLSELLLINEKFKEKVSSEKLLELKEEAKSLREKITELRVKDEPITKEEVDRGIALINEIKEIILK